jgi:restriction system protein
VSRRRNFIGSLVQAQIASERLAAVQLRNQTVRAREAERAQRTYERSERADQRERARLHVESRAAEAAALNERLDYEVARLKNLLGETLWGDLAIDFESLKRNPEPPAFDAGVLATEEPPPEKQAYLPPPLSFFSKLLPGAKKRRQQKVRVARERFDADSAAHARRKAVRKTELAEAIAKHEPRVAEIRNQTALEHAEVEKFKQEYASGSQEAIVDYCDLALKSRSVPEGFPHATKIAYVPESKQLVVELDLPTLEAIPEAPSYKYVKAKDEVVSSPRPVKEQHHLYASVVAQMALRTLHILFAADRAGHIQNIVFNGYVDGIDQSTGHPVRPCLATVRVSRDAFEQLDLERVEPAACLKALNASVSRSPAELVPVRPVMEFRMVDPRFVKETDVLSELDKRPNLMELTPSEFESLITNLFVKMGLETRLTRPSRDGGVDCIAYDARPILGGKVVIQAKRYKNTVGVSAVRDLYGTMANERASKGILVTTTGYGRASYEFADGKPLELLTGSNLLFLLSEHAGIQAKIEVLEDWKDPEPDREE